MKYVLSFMLAFISFSAMAKEFVVQDVLCHTFDYYHSQKMCLLLIKDKISSVGLLVSEKTLIAKVPRVEALLKTRISAEPTQLLMLSFEEEENVRNFMNYPEAPYYLASPKDFKLLDF